MPLAKIKVTPAKFNPFIKVPEIPDDIANETWRIGYQTAIETGDSAVMAIPPMLQRGQIIVTKTE
ncbi:MAG: hypothetical protein ACFKPT_02720 [Gloeotrichia echinulata GP01]